MFLIVAGTLAGGASTVTLLAFKGWLFAVACAPLGASACALLAGCVVAFRAQKSQMQRAELYRQLDEQTDSMVAQLRSVADRSCQPQAGDEAPVRRTA